MIPFMVVVAGDLAWIAFGFFGIQALFVDREIEEEIPDSISNLISGSAASEGGELLGKGSFMQGDSTYTVSGEAFLSRIDGGLNLTFAGFEVTNGPDLQVYAVKAGSTENEALKEVVSNGGFIHLGSLKGNIGDQNYELEFDPKEYQVVSIWCRRFGSVQLAADAPPSEP